MVTRTRISRDSLKQPNQESSDRATAYRIWPAKHKPVLQFPSEPQRQLPRAQGRRSPNQGASMPRSSVVLRALFPTESRQAQTRRMKKGQGRALAFKKWLNRGGLTPGPARMALVRVRRGVIVVLVRTIRIRLVWMRRIGRRMVRSLLWLVRPSVGSFRRGR